MSTNEYVPEPDESTYSRYLQECRAKSLELGVDVIPTQRDYVVWRAEQDLDEDENEGY